VSIFPSAQDVSSSLSRERDMWKARAEDAEWQLRLEKQNSQRGVALEKERDQLRDENSLLRAAAAPLQLWQRTVQKTKALELGGPCQCSSSDMTTLYSDPVVHMCKHCGLVWNAEQSESDVRCLPDVPSASWRAAGFVFVPDFSQVKYPVPLGPQKRHPDSCQGYR
jgi:hypothetical protein